MKIGLKFTLLICLVLSACGGAETSPDEVIGSSMPSTTPGELSQFATEQIILDEVIGSSMPSTTPGELSQSATEQIILDEDQFELKPANPLIVNPLLNEEFAVSGIIPISGGTLTAIGSDGTVYFLEIPPDALLSDQLVTMTPLDGIDGLDLDGGFLAGVHLEPEGLLLFQPAYLTITPDTPYPIAEEISFAVHGQARELLLYPIMHEIVSPTFMLTHFSDYGIGYGSDKNRQTLLDHSPSQTADQLIHEMTAYLIEQRNLQLNGKAPDSQFFDRLKSYLFSYYKNVLQPKIALALNSDDWQVACNVLNEFLSWERQRQLFGFTDDPEHQVSEVELRDNERALTERYYTLVLAEAEKICSVDPISATQIILSVVRQNAIGYNFEKFNLSTDQINKLEEGKTFCPFPKLYFVSNFKTFYFDKLIQDYSVSTIIELVFSQNNSRFDLVGNGSLDLEIWESTGTQFIGTDSGSYGCDISWDPVPGQMDVRVDYNLNMKGCEEYKFEITLSLENIIQPQANLYEDCTDLNARFPDNTFLSGPLDWDWELDWDYKWIRWNHPYPYQFTNWNWEKAVGRVYAEFEGKDEVHQEQYLFEIKH